MSARRPRLSCTIVSTVRVDSAGAALTSGNATTRRARCVIAASAAAKAGTSSCGFGPQSTHRASAPAASKAAASASHSPRLSGIWLRRTPTLT